VTPLEVICSSSSADLALGDESKMPAEGGGCL
jgi:hypothetical protein